MDPPSAETLGALEVVAAYKQLAEVEKAFRIMKGFALEVEPIRHRRERRKKRGPRILGPRWASEARRCRAFRTRTRT